jgi:hypothetical protein
VKQSGLPRTGADILTVTDNNGIDPSSGKAVLQMTCSLSTLPLLEHRLTFTAHIDLSGNSQALQASTGLRVAHGPFAAAAMAVEPVTAAPSPIACLQGLHARTAARNSCLRKSRVSLAP